MSLKVITGPASEPVSLQEAKLHLRIIADVLDVSANPEDALVSSLIMAARQGAENLTGRALMPQTLELALYDFPRVRYHTVSERWPRYISEAIKLPNPPLVSVTSVKYVDQAGVEQTLAVDAYQLDDYSEPAALSPAYGTCWPCTRCQPNAVIIRYEAGYADTESVPSEIKAWMLLRIGMLYANRESVSTGVSVAAVPYVDRLLDAYRVYG